MNWDEFLRSLNKKTDDAPIIVDDSAAKTSSQNDESEIDEDLIAALALLGLPMIAKNNE